MLQKTIKRLEGLNHVPPLLVCNEEHRFIVAEQIRQLQKPHSGIFLEPAGRNTAPAIALAALKAVENDDDPLLLVLAADHVIENVDAFHEAVNEAVEHATKGKLVTFGIVANTPETGYGYIKKGEKQGKGYLVQQFVEKPNLNKAKEYINSGDYLWNSGMFLFRASRYLEELKNHRPEIFEACHRAMNVQNVDLDFIRVDKSAFLACPDESVDYAVMEHTDEAIVIPMDAKWNDVGGFEALWQVQEKDECGNVLNGDVMALNTTNSLIQSENKLVAAIGLDNLVIISTKDAVLVADKESAQQVKSIVEQLKAQNRKEVKYHREVYRPWGKYDSIDMGERFQVKRITVKPGAKLSVQMHHHRAEHWIVVSGTAKVTIDSTEKYLTENESVYIPITAVHALENPGKVDLELIEVQSGSYLEEDDIVRFEDRYGRD